MKKLPLPILIILVSLYCTAQNVGIGTTTPNFPLSFPNTLGDKISLWGTSGAHYGIGVQSLTLQIHTDIPTADIAFGYGTSSAFTENMRIKGNGNLGIGTTAPGAKLHISSGLSGYSGGYFPGMIVESNGNTYLDFLTPTPNENGILFGTALNAANGGIIYNNTSNPNGLQFRTNGNTTRMVIDNAGRVGIGVSPTISDGVLDVNGRMRIRSGGDIFHTAGTWLNNLNNSSLQAFIGMNDDDSHVGFYGSGNGWGFAMNTNTGALQVNGSEGSPGQAIVSNGSAAAPSWSSLSNWLFNNVNQMTQTTNNVDIPQNGQFITIPTMDVGNFSLTVNGPAKLILCLSATINTNNCFGCGGANAGIGSYIYLNGSPLAAEVLAGSWVGNNALIWVTSGIQMFNIAAGTYTFRTQAINNGGQDFFVSFSRLMIIAIPQ